MTNDQSMRFKESVVFQNEEDGMSISERISQLRQAIGISRKEFGQILGISFRTLEGIEQRGNVPKSDILVKISEKWPSYSLWLLTGEDAPLVGQLSPIQKKEGFSGSDLSYQIIDVIDRNLDKSIVKSDCIEKVIFLHTDNVPVSKKTNRILDTFHSKQKSVLTQSEHVITSGTGMLLVISGEPISGFKRAVLVKDGLFDIREIERKQGIYGLLGDYKRWFDENGIRKFEIASVHHKTLLALRIESDELRSDDLYPISNDIKPSFTQWCESFMYNH